MEFGESRIKLINIIKEVFQPTTADSTNKAVLKTSDIYEKVQSIWPDREAYTSLDIVEVLRYLKFDGVHCATDNYFWLVEEMKLSFF